MEREREREREREAALILMMHMKMKGEEEEERGDCPKKGYEAFTAHLARLSTCTRSGIRGMKSLSLKHLQTATYLPCYSFYWENDGRSKGYNKTRPFVLSDRNHTHEHRHTSLPLLNEL